MKTNRLMPLLTSVYFSAMLTSSLAPFQSSATLAAAFNPSAAQEAFGLAVNNMDASGWPETVRISAPIIAALQSNSSAQEDWIARMIVETEVISNPGENTPTPASISTALCRFFELCGQDRLERFPLHTIRATISPDNNYYFSLPLEKNSKDILIMVFRPDIRYYYLTDKTGMLKKAAFSSRAQGGVNSLPNETAEKDFKKELAIFMKAVVFPPAEAAAPGNS